MCGNRGVNYQNAEDAERRNRPEHPAEGECEPSEQQRVQGPHSFASSSLNQVRIIVLIDIFLGKITFVGFVMHLAKRAEMKSRGRDDGADPELHQWRVFGIDAEISSFHIRNAGQDVVALILRETVVPGSHCGTNNGAGDEADQQDAESAVTESAECVSLCGMWAARR